MLREGMFDTKEELITFGKQMIRLMILSAVGSYSFYHFIHRPIIIEQRVQRDSLVSRVEQLADLDGNGSLCNFEKLRVYEEIGKNPHLYISSFSNSELEAYLSRVEYRDTKNQINYLKGDARENE